MTSRPQPSDTPPPLASSDALRRAALARSAARGAVVARRRLAWRWTLFLLGRAALWLALPLAAGGWWWWQQPPTPPAVRGPAALPASAPASSAADVPSLLASAALPASAPASAAASQPFAN